jgi:hypothetical protein
MVFTDQKTIKEAANRLRINYSTAKHIIKSKKSMERNEAASLPQLSSKLAAETKHAAPVDI